MERTERIELTVLCLLYQENKILIQNRIKKDWSGYVLPGGHVEEHESFIDAVIREMKEETGYIIKNPKLCGIKQFPKKNGTRYVVILYKTDQFEGELTSSEEGEVRWIERDKLIEVNLVDDFMKLLSVFDEDKISEFLYILKEDGTMLPILK